MTRAKLGAIGLSAASIVILITAGCSSDDSSDPGSGPQRTHKAPTPVDSPGSKVSARGVDWPGPFRVTCEKLPGQIALSVQQGDGANGSGVAITIINGAVQGVTLGGAAQQNNTVTYLPGAPGTSASFTREGNTFTVTGTGTAVDLNNPAASATAPFSVIVACPAVTGE